MVCGIDIVEVCRIAAWIETRERALGRFFTAQELAYSARHVKTRAATLAGIFAAKEAFYKALGTGFRQGKWTDAEVAHTDLGAPYFIFHGLYVSLVSQYAESPALSISHDGAYAIAQVVWNVPSVQEGETK